MALAGNFATTGAFNTTFSQQASITLTLPATADTLVGRATTDTLTNKTLTAPVLGGTVTGTYTLGGSPTIAGAAISGATITTSTFNGNAITAGTGTLTLGAGKTLTASNTLILTGSDGASVNFGSGGTVLYSQATVTLSGDVTGSGTTAITTTVAKIAGVSVGTPTGTGNVVMSASPTLSGTVGGALTFSGAITHSSTTTLSGALTYGGVTLSNSVTGTGSMVASTSPTFDSGSSTGQAAMFESSNADGVFVRFANTGMGTIGFVGAAKNVIGGSLSASDIAIVAAGTIYLNSSLNTIGMVSGGETWRAAPDGSFLVGTQTGAGAGAISAAAGITSGGAITDSIGNLRSIPQNAQTSAYALVVGDNGKHISITTGGITVNSGIFSASQNVVMFNNSGSSQTITQGSGVTIYLAGTATTGNRTLAQRGLCTLLCIASNTFVISGAGLT